MKHHKAAILAVVLFSFSCIHDQPVAPTKVDKVDEMFKEVAPHIIQCFHRNGMYKDAVVESHHIDGQVLSVTGVIFWRGIVSDRTMKIAFQVDEQENYLVKVIRDDGILERDKQCTFERWTPMADYQTAAADSRDRLNDKVTKTIRGLLSAMNREKNR